jgi:integrase
MTRPASTDSGVLILPRPETSALLHRKQNPAVDPARHSLFRDDRWDLTPGLFEAHAVTCRLNFLPVPAGFRDHAKHYIWQLINHQPLRRLRSTRGTRLALRSVSLTLPRITTFLAWLDTHRITSCDRVTIEDLDRYLADVITLEATTSMKSSLLVEVRRLWGYRDQLPTAMRLPEMEPWHGDDPKDLLGGHVRTRENRTPRLYTDTIDLLLMWSLRFVEGFADDIIAAFHEHLRLYPYGPSTRKHGIQVERRSIGEVLPDLVAYLKRLRRRGEGLPGRVGEGGGLEVDWPHFVRLFRSATSAFPRSERLRGPVERSGLPIARDAYLDAPVTGLVDDRPWRSDRIGYTEALELAALLRTACLVVVSYLSGMRTGEVLNLERGCLSKDEVSGIWTIAGKKFKGAWDTDGNKIPEGQLREDPWVVVEQTARAITVLERLHDCTLLFPTELHPHLGNRSRTRHGLARRAGSIPYDVAAFLDWVKDYCAQTGRAHEVIPPDPQGAIGAARFRRTLAWHIVRKPRGLVAGAIQYGHLQLQITLGYGGSYSSGFPDEHAYEDWLFRLERLAEDHQLLAAGEHVSGPAAPTYVHPITQAHQQFAGRLLTSPGQAHDMLTNPLLQIYPGRAMTCVFDPAKALCQQRGNERDNRATPDQDDCRSSCRNIAYTDRDITIFRKKAKDLEVLLRDFLAPSPRYHRARAELDRVRGIIRNHTRTR